MRPDSWAISRYLCIIWTPREMMGVTARGRNTKRRKSRKEGEGPVEWVENRTRSYAVYLGETEGQTQQNERHSLTSDEDHYVMRPENVEMPM